MTPTNIASADIEDYFQVEAFASSIDRSTWHSYPCRVESNTHRLLDLFDECSVKGTYFILGWVAERFPRLVREIADRGHEVGCHSYWHRRIYTLTPGEFREDTQRAKNVLEQASGAAICGYRAPSFSITSQSMWAFDVLAELGFAYDSSVFPVSHDVYGMPGAPRTPFVVKTQSGAVVEYPMATFRVAGERNFPVGGGGYLRIFPFWYTALGVRRAWREGVPVVSYIHPWEIDPDQPRLGGPLKSRLRHYTNLSKTAGRWRKLVQLGPFSSFRDSRLAESAPLHDLKERWNVQKRHDGASSAILEQHR
jgi:polysaccharide deacetylase family protein (PEP-CTERM system associated)